MRHAIHFAWHFLAIALAVAALSLAFVELHGLDLRFSRNGQAWQLACTDGLLRLGNAPQIAIETKQIQEARDERVRDNEAREAETRNILRKEAWRSPAYEAALIKLKELKEGDAALAAREEADAAARSQPIEYEVALRHLILMTGALPAVSLFMMFLVLRRRLKRAGWTRRESVLAGTALGSALMILVFSGLWMRSKSVNDEILYEIQRLPGKKEFWIVGSRNGEIYCNYLENQYLRNLRQIPEPPHFPGGEQIYAPEILKSWAFTHRFIPSRMQYRRPLFFTSGFGASASSWGEWNRSSFTVPTLGRSLYASVPIWILMIPFIIPCLIGLRLLRKRFHRRQGCCEKCGYDLRESPDRCPECGMVRAAVVQRA